MNRCRSYRDSVSRPRQGPAAVATGGAAQPRNPWSRLFPHPLPAPKGRRSASVAVATILAACSIASAQEPPKPDLPDLVREYLLTDAPGDHTKLIDHIRDTAEDDWAAVAAALQAGQLWPAAMREPDFWVHVGSETRRLRVTLPRGYDPKTMYPALLFLPDRPPLILNVLRADSWNAAVRITASEPICSGGINEPAGLRSTLEAMLKMARQRFHIDSDRTYLGAVGDTAPEAWMMAFRHPHVFAHVLVKGPAPSLPYPEQVLPLLLDSLNATSVDGVLTRGETGASGYARGVCQIMNDYAKRKESPVHVLFPGTSEAEMGPEVEGYPGPSASWPSRPSGPVPVSHWFRYPEHGRAYWLRCTKFRGDVWEAEQISIMPGPGTNRDAYITEVIQSKMGYIGGRIEGNVITVETRRCDRVEILLGENFVDLSKPVVVRINGRERHNGVVTPSIADMLEHAYEEWEFQHPIVARMTFEVRGNSE